MTGKRIGNRPEFLSLKPEEREKHPYFNAMLKSRMPKIEDTARKVVEEGKGGTKLASHEELIRVGIEKFKSLLRKNWFVVAAPGLQMKYVKQAMNKHAATKIGKQTTTTYPHFVHEHFATAPPREFSQEVFNILKERQFNGLTKHATSEPGFKTLRLEKEQAEYAALQALKHAVENAPSLERVPQDARGIMQNKLKELAGELEEEARPRLLIQKRGRGAKPKYEK